jgi:hypothetical protein
VSASTEVQVQNYLPAAGSEIDVERVVGATIDVVVGFE